MASSSGEKERKGCRLSPKQQLGDEIKRIKHKAERCGLALGARVLDILHIAINDAYFAIRPDISGVATANLTKNSADSTFRLPGTCGVRDAANAVAGAAITALEKLYTQINPMFIASTTFQLNSYIKQIIGAFPSINALRVSYRFGVTVSRVINNIPSIKPSEHRTSSSDYHPMNGLYKFNNDPKNAVRIVLVDPNNPTAAQQAIRPYYGSFYGQTNRSPAVQFRVNGQATEHLIADPPVGFGINNINLYNATEAVNADFARLFALRMLQIPTQTAYRLSHRFPKYPSGHSVFGSALFQTPRLHYKRRDGLAFKDNELDNISSRFVSDELNSVNRDLRQPYEPNLPITEQVGTVRTRVERKYPSLWAAIFENGISRVWLGVHWQFDAFGQEDVIQ
ncbi:MAG: hypothetical protein Q9195_006558 [Heterodermia aff. obscurata]